MGCVNMTKESTGSGKTELSDKILTYVCYGGGMG